MIPVKQRREHAPPDSYGDCFAACVASILELPLDDVPDFYELAGDNWWAALDEWCFERGWWPVCVRPYGKVKTTPVPAGYAIAGGGSPRGHNEGHAVVALDGVIVHDPHPSDSGLAGDVEDYIVFLRLVPEASP